MSLFACSRWARKIHIFLLFCLKIFSSIGNSLCLFIFCQNDTCANKAALIELSHFVLKRRRTCTIYFSKFETIVSLEMCPPFRENLYLRLRTYSWDKSCRMDINKTDKTTYTPMATWKKLQDIAKIIQNNSPLETWSAGDYQAICLKENYDSAMYSIASGSSHILEGQYSLF